MVQLLPIVMAVACSVPAFAAPLAFLSSPGTIEARSVSTANKVLKAAQPIAHAAKGVIETAATIKSMVSEKQRRDVELNAREPQPLTPATLSTLKKLALAGHGLKSIAETAAAINSLIPEKAKQRRDIELETREPLTSAHLAKLSKLDHQAHLLAHGVKGTAEAAATVKTMIPDAEKQPRDLGISAWETFRESTKGKSLGHAQHSVKSKEGPAASNPRVPGQMAHNVDEDFEDMLSRELVDESFDGLD